MTRFTFLRLVTWWAGLALAVSPISAKTLEPSVSTVYYDVSGGTIDELLQQLNARGPRTSAGEPVFGYTDWKILWNYRYDQTDRGFALTAATVEAVIVYRLPRRVEPKTPDALGRNWSRFITALTLHERGHGNNAVNQAEKLQATLLSPRAFASLAELEGWIKQEGEKAIAAAQKWDLDFDRRTEHGRNQGAVLR